MTSDYKGILNNYTDLPTLVEKFGAFFLKPTTLKVLKKIYPYTDYLKITDKRKRLYIVGISANLCTITQSAPYRVYEQYIPIDSFDIPNGWSFGGPVSLLLVYMDGTYSDRASKDAPIPNNRHILRAATTKTLEQLITVVGIRKSLPKGSTFSASLVQSRGAGGAVKTATDKVAKVSLSRDEIVEMLKLERDNAIRENSPRRIAMYDAVISMHATYIRQSRGAKLVRMADGSRKWMPAEKAMEFLKLPVSERGNV